MKLVGVDVGGTNIQVGLVGDDHEVLARQKAPTPEKADEVVDVIAELVADLGHDVAAVGVGIPGIVYKGTVVSVPNLPGLAGEEGLTSQLRDRLGVPVEVGNDANLGVLGEWVAGAGQGTDFLLGVWLGTGVGGGLILDGKPYTGSIGAAGEIGHMIVRQGGARCGCGRRGCLEAYSGRRMMSASAEALVASGRTSSLAAFREQRGKSQYTSGVWAEALAAGDSVATEIIDEAIEVLGVGIGSVVNLLDVQQVVVGGGLAEKLGEDLAQRLAAAAEPVLLRPLERGFRVAELGDDSGVVGAAALARYAVK